MQRVQYISQADWYVLDEIILDIQNSTIENIYDIVEKDIKPLIPYSHSLSYNILNCFESEGKMRTCKYYSHDIPNTFLTQYEKKYVSMDFINWYIHSSTSPAFRESDVVPETIKCNTIFYQEWMQPINLQYGIVLPIKKDKTEYMCLTLYRSKEEGDFTDRELEILSVLSNHILNHFLLLYPFGLSDDGISPSLVSKTTEMLTKRESELVNLIVSGTLRTDLASKLFISENTLNKHLANIYEKTGCHTYEELIRLFNI